MGSEAKSRVTPRPKAASLIALANAPAATVSIGRDLAEQLAELLAYNDAQANPTRRIGLRQVFALCAAYDRPVGPAGLDRIARDVFGRKSWVTK